MSHYTCSYELLPSSYIEIVLLQVNFFDLQLQARVLKDTEHRLARKMKPFIKPEEHARDVPEQILEEIIHNVIKTYPHRGQVHSCNLTTIKYFIHFYVVVKVEESLGTLVLYFIDSDVYQM